uniref:Uncharacterized protein n=1 Tax=Solanum lycopersicum TaxID=4081 RepID=A0A494G8P5_SOLLC
MMKRRKSWNLCNWPHVWMKTVIITATSMDGKQQRVKRWWW